MNWRLCVATDTKLPYLMADGMHDLTGCNVKLEAFRKLVVQPPPYTIRPSRAVTPRG